MAKEKIKNTVAAAPQSQNDWEVEDAIRTLIRAGEIQANEELMAKVRPKLKKQMSVMRSIADLRHASKLMEEGEEE
jgi:hypothetical protein